MKSIQILHSSLFGYILSLYLKYYFLKKIVKNTKILQGHKINYKYKSSIYFIIKSGSLTSKKVSYLNTTSVFSCFDSWYGMKMISNSQSIFSRSWTDISDNLWISFLNISLLSWFFLKFCKHQLWPPIKGLIMNF